jgi:hypothetical protein
MAVKDPDAWVRIWARALVGSCHADTRVDRLNAAGVRDSDVCLVNHRSQPGALDVNSRFPATPAALEFTGGKPGGGRVLARVVTRMAGK